LVQTAAVARSKFAHLAGVHAFIGWHKCASSPAHTRATDLR